MRDRTAPRLCGADESYLLAEDLFGVDAPIQFCWVFEADPGDQAIDDLGHALAAGSLHRTVVRARVPGARHRWVRAATVPPAGRGGVIGDDEIGEWADRTLRSADVRPTTGAGWRLDSATTVSGRRVLSLLVSHMIADGQGVYRALADAAAGTSASLPLADSAGGLGGVIDDVVDAVTQVAAAGRAGRLLVLQLLRSPRRGSSDATGSARRTSIDEAADTDSSTVVDGRTTVATGPDGAASMSVQDAHPAGIGAGAAGCGSGDREPTLAIVDVDGALWQRRARECGGTANSLFTALLAGIVQRSTYPVGDQLRACIAVSRRSGHQDQRANASGGVWIRLVDPVVAGGDLSIIRARSKEAFTAYAETGADQVADNLQPVVRLLPRRLVGSLMRSIPGPDTTVSNLGEAPDEALTVGGVRASSFAIRAIMQGTPAWQRRRQGPALAAWAVTYDERITLTFFGIHPDHFGDRHLLGKLVEDELRSWGLAHRFW
ncbi:hypothetical protein GCM10009624_19110 [Gordonia sinesedis]